jgi:hypothetical protein
LTDYITEKRRGENFFSPFYFSSVATRRMSRDRENVIVKRGKWDRENVAFPLLH